MAIGVPDHTARLPPRHVVLLDDNGRSVVAVRTRCLLYRDPELKPAGLLAAWVTPPPPEVVEGFARELRSALVMPVTGGESLAALMAGGDYDGDTFHVILQHDAVAACWPRLAAQQQVTDPDQVPQADCGQGQGHRHRQQGLPPQEQPQQQYPQNQQWTQQQQYPPTQHLSQHQQQQQQQPQQPHQQQQQQQQQSQQHVTCPQAAPQPQYTNNQPLPQHQDPAAAVVQPTPVRSVAPPGTRPQADGFGRASGNNSVRPPAPHYGPPAAATRSPQPATPVAAMVPDDGGMGSGPRQGGLRARKAAAAVLAAAAAASKPQHARKQGYAEAHRCWRLWTLAPQLEDPDASGIITQLVHFFLHAQACDGAIGLFHSYWVRFMELPEAEGGGVGGPLCLAMAEGYDKALDAKKNSPPTMPQAIEVRRQAVMERGRSVRVALVHLRLLRSWHMSELA
ncbi:hypothetical protein TSOC_012800 [Tetrabaena socialis]|uniref:RNA-dependent RNA polymerase n=1 Tax=Tetrabaena socialis TaxID=47790 RepID=A0A2J7ZM30_9CHLO|nr:hypothetical protein TSOC_012800 [Tetrabaena socialis]|eukprot:PNH01324.1 hypothetical protein TSOC_012800 [Tetrabaena socialis]